MSTIKLREAQYQEDDLAGMWNLFRRLFGEPFSSCSLGEFRCFYQHFWLNNPARTPDHPLGWIIECPKEGVVGFVGLIPIRIQISGKEILGGGTSSFAVLPEYRVYSLALLKKVLGWGEKHFLLDTTSSPVGNQLHQKLKVGFNKIPIKKLDYYMLWVMRPEVFVRWALSRSSWQRWLTVVDLKPFSFLLTAAAIVRFARHRTLHFEEARFPVEQLTVFTDEFSRFWSDHKDQYGVTTVRDQAFLQWRYLDAPPILGFTRVFACRANGQLQGYLALLERKRQEGICPGHFRVLDVFYDRRKPEVVRSLMNHAYEFAKTRGGSIFEVSTVGLELQDLMRTARPYLKQANAWAYWYRAPTKDLAECCEREAWWPSRMDGAVV